jgi:hypothetical protein
MLVKRKAASLNFHYQIRSEISEIENKSRGKAIGRRREELETPTRGEEEAAKSKTRGVFIFIAQRQSAWKRRSSASRGKKRKTLRCARET